MRLAATIAEIVSGHTHVTGKVVADVGCGTGDLTRWLAKEGAEAVGVDTIQLIAKAGAVNQAAHEHYVAGYGQDLPLAAMVADLIVYAASLHHIPANRLDDALRECSRVLKPGGLAFFIEPLALPGTYYEITRLPEDEAEILKRVHGAIRALTHKGFRMINEEFYYFLRSFADYTHLIETFFDDEARCRAIISQAKTITEGFAAAAGVPMEDFRYRSCCRLNILQKI